MPLQLKSPEVRVIPLVKCDPTGETTVTIRQATMHENTQRADLWATASRIMRDTLGEELELKQRISIPEVMRTEVWLTLVGCNLQDAEGKDLFQFRRTADGRDFMTMTRPNFDSAWGTLPQAIALEIHEAVIAVNADWGTAAKVLTS